MTWHTDQDTAGNCCLSHGEQGIDSLCGHRACTTAIEDIGYVSLWDVIVRDEVAACCLDDLATELGFGSVGALRSKAERLYAGYAEEWYVDGNDVGGGKCLQHEDMSRCICSTVECTRELREVGYEDVWDVIGRGHLYEDARDDVADHFGYEDFGVLKQTAQSISRVVA